jgi:hypothetical protein
MPRDKETDEKSVLKEETQISFYIEPELKVAFKIKLLARNTTMKEVLTTFIKKYIEDSSYKST